MVLELLVQLLQLMQGAQLSMGVEIGLCNFNDIDDLISFINTDWKKNHIFVKDRKLFEWQHKCKNHYNFVLAKEKGTIIGILGFIPTSQYSNSLISNNEIWLAIWKVKEEAKRPGLGLMMLKFIINFFKNPTICSLGLSPQVISIYKVLKYNVGILSHNAFFNQKNKNYKIGKPDGSHVITLSPNKFKYKISNTVDQISETFFTNHPKKNVEYLIKRYAEHPKYNYSFLSFYDLNNLLSISICREINVRGKKISRIVDSFGENIMEPKFNHVISNFVERHEYEYIDLVSNLKRPQGSGFVSSSDTTIIPNYFEPFEKKNIDIYYAYKSENKLLIFRGDSDQDRPNL